MIYLYIYLAICLATVILGVGSNFVAIRRQYAADKKPGIWTLIKVVSWWRIARDFLVLPIIVVGYVLMVVTGRGGRGLFED